MAGRVACPGKCALRAPCQNYRCGSAARLSRPSDHGRCSIAYRRLGCPGLVLLGWCLALVPPQASLAWRRCAPAVGQP